MNRPSPFALPPAVSGHFGLLILATVTSSSYLYSWIARWLPFVAGADHHCAEQATAAAPHVLPDALVAWYSDCSTWATGQEAVAVAAMLLVLVLGVLAHYLVAPRMMRRGLTPLAVAAEASPAEAQRVTRVIDEAGLTDKVRVYVNPAVPRASSAFGRRGRYAIVLGSADFTGPEGEAVLAHEVGHLRNADVDLTSLTTAVWRCYLLLAAVPALVGSWSSPDGLWYYGWRIVALLGLVYVLRCRVIRSREFYADWRAVGGAMSGERLMAAFGRRGPEGTFWERRFHPRRGLRSAVLQDPAPLFRLDLATAAAAGALVGLAYRPGYHLVSIVWPAGVFGKEMLCGLLFGGMAAATVAGGTWRATLWPADRGRAAALRTVALACCFTASLLVGDFIAPGFPGMGSWASAARLSPGPGVAVAVVLAVGFLLFVQWTATSAATRLATGQAARRKYHLGLLVAGPIGGLGLGFWFRLAEFFQLVPEWRSIVFGLATSALVPVPLIAVWLALVYAATASAAHRPHPVEVDRDLRAPWGLVGAATVAIPAVYAVGLAADHAAITAALARVDADPAALGPVAYLLYVPAIVVAAAGSLLTGLLCPGRRRTSLLLASLGSVLPLLAAVLFLVSLGFVVAFDRIDRGFLTLVTGLGHLPGVDPADRPDHAALGLMVLALYAALLVSCLPAAWLGNRLRRRFRPGTAGYVPLPSHRRTAARLAPLVAATVAIAALGLREWTTAVTSTGLRLGYDTTAVQVVADRVDRGSLSGPQACGRLLSGETVSYEIQTDAGAAAQLAGLAAVGMSSRDVVLQQLGRGAMDSLNLREMTGGAAAVGHLLRYCAST